MPVNIRKKSPLAYRLDKMPLSASPQIYDCDPDIRPSRVRILLKRWSIRERELAAAARIDPTTLTRWMKFQDSDRRHPFEWAKRMGEGMCMLINDIAIEQLRVNKVRLMERQKVALAAVLVEDPTDG